MGPTMNKAEIPCPQDRETDDVKDKYVKYLLMISASTSYC